MTAGLQLYSMREYPDQIALLGLLAQAGVRQVEGFDGVYGDPATYRQAMDTNGITMPCGHIKLADLESDFGGSVHLARTLGMTHVFAPYLEPAKRPHTSAGYAALAKRLHAVGRSLSREGLSFGWHNQEFEFETLSRGAMPMDIIMGEAPDLLWEADLAWIVRGGGDPVQYLNAYSSRLASIHVKDIAAACSNDDEDGWAALGQGVLDWRALLRECRAQSPDLNYFLEHDKPQDALAYLRASVQAFGQLWGQSHG